MLIIQFTLQRKLYYCGGSGCGGGCGGGDGGGGHVVVVVMVVGVVLELTKVDFLCSIIDTHSFSVSEKRM